MKRLWSKLGKGLKYLVEETTKFNIGIYEFNERGFISGRQATTAWAGNILLATLFTAFQENFGGAHIGIIVFVPWFMLLLLPSIHYYLQSFFEYEFPHTPELCWPKLKEIKP